MTHAPLPACDAPATLAAGNHECHPSSLNGLPATFYQDAFAQSPVGIGVFDGAGRLLQCNHAYAAALGFDPASLVGRSVYDLTHAEDVEATRTGFRHLSDGTITVFDNEKRYTRKDGQIKWVRVSIALVRSGGLESPYAVEFLRDISGRKRTEEALRVVSERMALAAESAGIGVWEWDRASNRFYWDDRMYVLFGRTRSDQDDLYALWAASMHSEDRARTEEAFSRAMQGLSRFDTEFRVVLPTGAVRHLKAAAEVIMDSQGLPLRVVGLNFDITERKAAEQATLASEHKFRSLFELSPVGIALNDLATGQFLHLNDALAAPTGFSREELLTMTYWDLTPPQFQEKEQNQITSLQQTDRYGPYETEYLRKDGTTYPVLLSGIRILDGLDRPMIWSIVQDISARKAMEERLTDAARRDQLTGLANRAVFMERLSSALTRVRSGKQLYFAVLFLDFDRFKLTNDTLGHDAGDELLRQIAVRLKRELRAADLLNMDESMNVVSRFGGDEFLILINDLKSVDDATVIASRLLKSLSPVYTLNGSDVHSSASIGIIASDQCQSSADDIVRKADVAMYEAKRAGRARAVVFTDAMQTRLSRHVTIENELRRALGTAQLYLVYQPIIELATGRVMSVEALARWNHPTLGIVSPAEFVPIAEETGLIAELGQWVQHGACRDLVAWQRAEPAVAPRMVSVNVSRAELGMGAGFLQQVRATLRASGLPAECLQLEITEREVMRQPEEARALLVDLRAIGVQLAMDDFGTGTSSLGCLRHYPFDTIKLDRSFVQDLTKSPDTLAVIHATVHLVENLGMASLAEGVEEAAQVAVLLSLGCRYAQGYHFSHPVASDRLLGTIRARQAKQIESGERPIE